MNRFREKWCKLWCAYFLAAIVHLSLSVPHVDGFYSQRQRYASRMLKITPKECSSPEFPNVTGVCMISLECQQRSGTVIGACRDGHLFGACCHDPLAPQLKSSTSVITESTTPTTTTTTESEPSSSSASSSSQQENNEVIPIDSEAQLDSQTAIPSLIDTFSELSPTFLSELALDEHTTGMYASLSSVHDDDNAEQEGFLLRQKTEEEEDQTSAANMISNEIITSTTDRNPRTSTSTEKYHGLDVILNDDHEVGGVGGVGMEVDDDFKDNMIKYIDDIVTMRTNEMGQPMKPSSSPEESESEVSASPPPPSVPAEVPAPPPPPPAVMIAEPEPSVKAPDSIEDMPFSTFTIVSSTKPTPDGNKITHSYISTTGSGDSMLPTTTTPVPTPSSEEVLAVSIQQSIASLPSSTESNEIRDTTESTVPHYSSTESVKPTKFTFSKLKYSPKPFKPRSTTEKIVWTRPTSAPSPFNKKPVDLDEDPEDEEEEEEEDDHHNNIVLTSSTSTQANSIEQTTIASSTEGGSASSSTEGYSTYLNDENVEDQQYNGGDSSTQEYPYYASSPSTTYDDPALHSSPTSYGDPALYSSPSSHYDDPALYSSPSTYSFYPPSTYSSYPPSSPSTYSSYPPSSPSTYSSYPPSSPSSSYPPSSPSSSSSYPPSSPSSSSSYYDDPALYSSRTTYPSYSSSSPSSSQPPTSEPSSSPSTTGFGLDWTSPTILSLLKGATELITRGVNISERSDLINSMTEAAAASTTENEIDSSPSSSSTTWKSTFFPSTFNTALSSSTPRTSSPENTGSFSPKPTGGSSSAWDSSIDSFVDQVVEGIVHDLNKSNKIDDIIFNNQNQANANKKIQGSTSSASTTPLATSTMRSSSKEKTKTKTKSKKTSTRTKTSTSSESPVPSTTSKEKLKKVKTPAKVPASVASTTSKRRRNKNKAKPVKKVTTSSIKTANSTRKRLDYKKDCGVRPLIKKGRIVGGTPSQFGSWPWHALVKETVWWGIFSKIKCGGVLIGAQHVLTAAHCQPQQTGTLSVVLGITDSDDTDTRAVTKTVKRIIPHPQFNARTYENDIAILELESPVDFQPHVVPICLPRDDDELEGKTAHVTGMGLLKHDGERPLVLQEVDLPILNNTECQKMFVRSGNMKPIIDSFICAGYEQGRKDSCGGDSGGPLSVKRSNGQWVLAGTVSHGIKCALPDQPGVYMRTSYYKPWIDRVLNVARSRYRGIPRCNAPPLICARQRQHQQQLRQHQARHENGFVNTLFRIFRLARKMVEEGRKSQG